MRTVTLEEHFVTQDFLEATGAYGQGASPALAAVQAKLLDLGPGRLHDMDEAKIDVQVLSLASIGLGELPAEEQTAVMQGVHDELAAAVKTHPDRLAAFATPGLKQPEEAVREIERCITQLGFKGVMLDGTTDGKFLDAPEFRPVLEVIAKLGVPLYIHPAPPPKQVADVYYSGLPGEAGYLLSLAGWGWHAENGLHILRLIVSGVMDKLPELTVIVGHMGEGVPYALTRSSGILSRVAKLQRSVADTFKEQVYVTTSGYFTVPPFECARAVVGPDRLMYSVDYPFSPNMRGVEFLEQLQLESGEHALFCGERAVELLKL